MEAAVLYQADSAGIVTLTLNRPELRNPISGDDVVNALCDALDRLENDPAARVAILTGAGKAFSSGGDINAMKPGGGGAWLLQRVVGFSKAAEMSLTGDMLGAAEALACGLVSRVVPDAELLDAAKALASKIAANPPFAVRMTKRLLWEARRADLPTILEMSAAMQAVAHATSDHNEAVDAFLEKRTPAFKGD